MKTNKNNRKPGMMLLAGIIFILTASIAYAADAKPGFFQTVGSGISKGFGAFFGFIMTNLVSIIALGVGIAVLVMYYKNRADVNNAIKAFWSNRAHIWKRVQRELFPWTREEDQLIEDIIKYFDVKGEYLKYNYNKTKMIYDTWCKKGIFNAMYFGKGSKGVDEIEKLNDKGEEPLVKRLIEMNDKAYNAFIRLDNYMYFSNRDLQFIGRMINPNTISFYMFASQLLTLDKKTRDRILPSRPWEALGDVKDIEIRNKRILEWIKGKCKRFDEEEQKFLSISASTYKGSIFNPATKRNEQKEIEVGIHYKNVITLKEEIKRIVELTLDEFLKWQYNPFKMNEIATRNAPWDNHKPELIKDIDTAIRMGIRFSRVTPKEGEAIKRYVLAKVDMYYKFRISKMLIEKEGRLLKNEQSILNTIEKSMFGESAEERAKIRDRILELYDPEKGPERGIKVELLNNYTKQKENIMDKKNGLLFTRMYNAVRAGQVGSEPPIVAAYHATREAFSRSMFKTHIKQNVIEGMRKEWLQRKSNELDAYYHSTIDVEGKQVRLAEALKYYAKNIGPNNASTFLTELYRVNVIPLANQLEKEITIEDWRACRDLIAEFIRWIISQ